MFSVEMQQRIEEVKQRISNVLDEKYKVAFMYQFLLGSKKSEVCGDYRPIGDDVKKVEIISNEDIIEAVLFRCRIATKKDRSVIVYCLWMNHLIHG